MDPFQDFELKRPSKCSFPEKHVQNTLQLLGFLENTIKLILKAYLRFSCDF